MGITFRDFGRNIGQRQKHNKYAYKIEIKRTLSDVEKVNVKHAQGTAKKEMILKNLSFIAE